jgi:hypothetical protein
MMHAVHGYPFPGDHGSSQPEPEAKKMSDGRMQGQRIVRLIPIQEYDDTGDSDMCQDQCHTDVTRDG